MKFTKRLLSLLLTVAICVGLFAALGSVSAKKTEIPDDGYTFEERQQAFIETAVAYNIHAPYTQYDQQWLTSTTGIGSGGSRRINFRFTPEECTSDHNCFTICCNFQFEVVYETIGYELLGDPLRCVTDQLCMLAPEEMVVFKYDNNLSKSKEDREAAAAMFHSLLQPGDLIVVRYFGDSNGHAVMYAGDVWGDGVPQMSHSSGSDSKSTDPVWEAKGSATIEPFANRFGPGQYLDLTKEGSVVSRYTILRPALMPYGLTDNAKARMHTKRLNIQRTVSEGYYGCAPTDTVMTYDLSIQSRHTETQTVPVEEIIPEGVELVPGSITGGGKATGNKINWTITIKPEETIHLTYKVKITAQRGAQIVSTGGNVGGIRSNTLKTLVCGDYADCSAAKDPAKLEELVKSTELSGMRYVEKIYNDVLGIDLELPNEEGLFYGMFQKVFNTTNNWHLKDPVDDGYEIYRKMLEPRWFGGKQIFTDADQERTSDPKLTYLHDGDILFMGTTKKGVFWDSQTYIILDHMAYGSDGKQLLTFTNEEFEIPQNSWSHSFFMVFRPSLAYDNVKTLTESDMKFTDVKENDWFFPYVRDLVADGTVAGVNCTTFAPKGELTYGQALKMIALTAGEKEQNTKSGHWADGYLAIAKNKGWLDGNINLDAKITRLEFCKLAAKAMHLIDQPEKNPFNDCKDVYVLALYNAGIIDGLKEGTFAPDKLLTRAQISKIIWSLRAMKTLKTL